MGVVEENRTFSSSIHEVSPYFETMEGYVWFLLHIWRRSDTRGHREAYTEDRKYQTDAV